jgi:glutamine amidotransferase
VGIGIIDVGLSNIGSLRGALYSEGWDTELIKRPEDLDNCSHLILPGVGSFFEGMRRLEKSGLADAIRGYSHEGKPLFGICLGMQLLASSGDEGGGSKGLSLIPGHVGQLPALQGTRVPHVGWNSVYFVQNHPVLEGIKPGTDFYFVHSYCYTEKNTEHVLAWTEYGEKFTSCIGNKNIIGVQFHPEKSQRSGLKILDNFCRWQGDA